MIFPIDFKTIDMSNPLSIVEELKVGKELPFTDYYLGLDNDYLNELEILLGPCTTDADFDKVTEIIKRNRINAKVMKSELNY